LKAGVVAFAHLDATQLVKHAFALRTAVHKEGQRFGKLPVLFYVFAEPVTWPSGRELTARERAAHRAEIERFADAVGGDEVQFRSCSYVELMQDWASSKNLGTRAHATALHARFRI
jgi:hypothetical protein